MNDPEVEDRKPAPRLNYEDLMKEELSMKLKHG
jgi:hypothetical protein